MKNQRNSKYYKEVTPELYQSLVDYRKNHPINTIIFRNKEIEYISCGTGVKTVLTFHGALGNAEGNFQAIRFFEKNYRVIAPSITNFESLDEFSEAVNEILKKENVEKYILIGQSFGSFMAQPYFHRNYKNVEALILINSYPPKNEWLKDFKKAEKLLKFMPTFLLRKVMSKKLLKLANEDKEMNAEIQEEFSHLRT